MIVEERIYILQTGSVPEYLRLYESEGMVIQTKILGNLIGYFHCEIGPQNQVVHMWGYDSFEDRTRRRGELMADADWRAFMPKIRPLILRQENKLLIPAPFSPIGAA